MHQQEQAFNLVKFAKEKGGSVEEFILAHLTNIEKNPALKALFTKDARTLKIANKVLQNNEFVKSAVMQSKEGESSNQIKSQEVKISDIKSSKYFAEFREKRSKKSIALSGVAWRP